MTYVTEYFLNYGIIIKVHSFKVWVFGLVQKPQSNNHFTELSQWDFPWQNYLGFLLCCVWLDELSNFYLFSGEKNYNKILSLFQCFPFYFAHIVSMLSQGQSVLLQLHLNVSRFSCTHTYSKKFKTIRKYWHACFC